MAKRKQAGDSVEIRFPKVQHRCANCGCKSSLHAVAQMAGKHCICDKCPGWKRAADAGGRIVTPVERYNGLVHDECPHLMDFSRSKIDCRRCIEAAFASVAAETREECAKVAEAEVETERRKQFIGRGDERVPLLIAENIRALGSKP